MCCELFLNTENSSTIIYNHFPGHEESSATERYEQQIWEESFDERFHKW